MTLQEMFLFGTFIYYLFKGSLFGFYTALVIVKTRREQQKTIQAYLRKRARNGKVEVAYNLCEKQ